MVDEEAHEPPELIKVELSLQQTHHYEMEHGEKYADYYFSHDVYTIKSWSRTYVIVVRSMLKGRLPVIVQKSRSMSRRILNSTASYG